MESTARVAARALHRGVLMSRRVLRRWMVAVVLFSALGGAGCAATAADGEARPKTAADEKVRDVPVRDVPVRDVGAAAGAADRASSGGGPGCH